MKAKVVLFCYLFLCNNRLEELALFLNWLNLKIRDVKWMIMLMFLPYFSGYKTGFSSL